MENRELKLIRLADVLDIVGVSEASIYRLMASGQFPKSIPITTKTRGWIESEVYAWVQGRIDAARGVTEAPMPSTGDWAVHIAHDRQDH